MSRPIVLSNGEMNVGLNDYGMVHDFFYPYVGFENHTIGADTRHKIGVYVDGGINWLDNGDWQFNFSYPHDALIGRTVAKNYKIGIILEFDDFVDANISAFMRNIHVVNAIDRPREIKLFMHQAFKIGDSASNTDTAQYLPDNDAILHYRGRRAFVVTGNYHDKPFDQYAIGIFGIEGKEGTFRDAEDGELNQCYVEHGRVDSTIRFSLNLGPLSSDRLDYSISAGKSIREALYVNKQIKEAGFASRLTSTSSWWHKWLKTSLNVSKRVPKEHQHEFITSLMVLKAHIDNKGAVIASTDSSMLNYSRDAYAYCWPRDAALVLWPLIRLGFKDEPHRFFQFAKRTLHPSGYLSHKYRPDGAIGSSWHPYKHGNISAPPIQEDETALTIFMLAQYYEVQKDKNILKEFYKDLILPASNFLSEFIDYDTNLPKPSYDLWEEIFAVSPYTVAVTQAALIAASDLANEMNDSNSAVKWRAAAEDIQTAAKEYLFNEDKKYFYRGILFTPEGEQKNAEVDTSSFFGSYFFGLFTEHSNQITESFKTLTETFLTEDNQVSLPRYTNDYYRKTSSNYTGNYWLISSLWLAQYYISKNENAKALRILDWVKSTASSAGMLGEQVNPNSGEIIAPSPLAWSHAEYISTLLDLIACE
ncbi:glycoside hydrolase family 15 protein [Candidatus Saccharibacteria bacterium]|nr:glycoside hydrolase family 15 protein [Candidatus Saccharibacteria bacterium]